MFPNTLTQKLVLYSINRIQFPNLLFNIYSYIEINRWCCKKRLGVAEKYETVVNDIYDGSVTLVRCAAVPND